MKKSNIFIGLIGSLVLVTNSYAASQIMLSGPKNTTVQYTQMNYYHDGLVVPRMFGTINAGHKAAYYPKEAGIRGEKIRYVKVRVTEGSRVLCTVKITNQGAGILRFSNTNPRCLPARDNGILVSLR